LKKGILKGDFELESQLCDSTKGAIISTLVVLLIGLFLSSCAPVGPDFVKPEFDETEQWSRLVASELATSKPEMEKWWQVFNDPVLNTLVGRAHKNNNTTEIAALRVLEARAQLGIAVGTIYPQSQRALGDATYISTPDNTGFGSSDWSYNLGASAAWEIDFWGKFRRGIESADAAFLASVAAYDQALVLLTAAVVDTYTIIRTAEEQLRITYQNGAIQQKSYDIATVLYKNGETSELDMQQAYTLLLSTQASIPTFETQLIQTQNVLSVLLGQQPGSVNTLLSENTGIPTLPDEISIGFPADMLRHRPDVRQAELLAMAQNARVGVANAQLYPNFSLVGSIGLVSGGAAGNSFGDLFDSGAVGYSVGPSFVWPFFNYGRIKNNVRVQDARLQQALVNYRETVLQAAREAENAMAGFIGARKQTLILEKTVQSAERSNELSTFRYKEGFSDYLRVLNSQQSLVVQQQRYITTQSIAVNNFVALYKALGGGWEDRQGPPYIDPETLKTMENRTDWGKLLESGMKEPDRTKSIPTVDW
jgi:NodT family efflux transporter outer membrane factor (OMF) lipoprotein